MRKSLITGRRLGFLEFEFVVDLDPATCQRKLQVEQIEPAKSYRVRKMPKKSRLTFRWVDSHSFRLALRYPISEHHTLQGQMAAFPPDKTIFYGRMLPHWDIRLYQGVGVILLLTLITQAIRTPLGQDELLIALVVGIWALGLVQYVTQSKEGLAESLKQHLLVYAAQSRRED